MLTWWVVAKAPDITLVHRPPKSVVAGRAVVIRGQMTGASEVERAEIRFRLRGDPAFDSVELEVKQGDEYEGSIPAERVREGMLEYYVVAVDFVGKSREVYASAKRPQRLLVEEATRETPPTPAPTPVVPQAPPAADTKQLELPASQPVDSRVWTSSELESLGVVTLADVLERMSDLQVARRIDGTYQVSRAGVRDAGAIVVLVDGQPLTSLAFGMPDLRLPIRVYERVEVTLSSTSATDIAAPLAVVALFSKRAPLDVRALAGSDAGYTLGPGSRSFGSYDGVVSGGGTRGAFTAHGRAGIHYASGAQIEVARDALTPSGVSYAPGLTNDRALRLQVGGSAQLAVAREHKLGLDLDFYRLDHGGYAGLYDIFSPAGGSAQNLGRAQLSLHGQAGVSYRAALGYRLLLFSRDRMLVPPGNAPAPDGERERLSLSEHAIDGDARAEVKLGGSNVLSGRATLAQHLLSGALTRDIDAYAVPSQRTTVTLAVADRLAPLRWLEIDVGARFTFMSDIGFRDLASILTPVAALTFRPLDGLQLRISYDTAVRGPTLFERTAIPLFEDRGILGNPSLRYMTARTVAFEASYTRERYRAELRGYYLGTSGVPYAIDPNGNGAELAAFFSQGGGAGGYLRAGFARASFVRGGVSWHRAVSGGTLLVDTPQLSAVLMANIEVSTWFEVYLSLTYYAERRNNARHVSETLRPWVIPAQTVAHGQLRTRAFAGVRFLIIAQNAFDAARRDPAPRSDRLPDLVPREGLRLLFGAEFALGSER